MNASKKARTDSRSADGNKVMVEWTIAEDDQAWQLAVALPATPAAPAPGWRWSRRWWGAAGAVVILLLAVGGWVWHQAHAGLAQIEGELHMAVVAEQWIAEQDQRVNVRRTDVPQEIAATQPSSTTGVEILDLGGDWALVRVITQRGERTFRQTHFLHQDVYGWSAAAPKATHWGKARTLESTHFIFHYYERDADAVAEAAAKLDALYPEVAASYLPDLAYNDKIWVRVSPEHPTAESVERGSGAALKVSSPALSLAPIELSEGEILAQVVLLEALNDLTYRSLEPYLRDASYYGETVARVHDFLESLKLWHLWNTDLPLAALYAPTMQWIVGDGQGERGLPSYDAGLCSLHSMWNATPHAIQVPLFCGDAQQVARHEVGRYLPSALPRSLADIHFFAATSADEPARGMVEAERVGLATLLDYVAITYGRQSLAELIVNSASYPSWKTLIPTTFGVSASEFEAGWQAHLADLVASGFVKP
jgi:hypothetical protein